MSRVKYALLHSKVCDNRMSRPVAPIVPCYCSWNWKCLKQYNALNSLFKLRQIKESSRSCKTNRIELNWHSAAVAVLKQTKKETCCTSRVSGLNTAKWPEWIGVHLQGRKETTEQSPPAVRVARSALVVVVVVRVRVLQLARVRERHQRVVLLLLQTAHALYFNCDVRLELRIVESLERQGLKSIREREVQVFYDPKIQQGQTMPWIQLAPSSIVRPAPSNTSAVQCIVHSVLVYS